MFPSFKDGEFKEECGNIFLLKDQGKESYTYGLVVGLKTFIFLMDLFLVQGWRLNYYVNPPLVQFCFLDWQGVSFFNLE